MKVEKDQELRKVVARNEDEFVDVKKLVAFKKRYKL